MSEKTYKIVESEKLSTYDEKRYIVVDIKTGKVLDNAQGYGYKSIKKAYSAYGYKKRDKSKDKEKQLLERKIRNWLLEHKEFEETMEIEAFEIVKGSNSDVKKFSKTSDYLPFELSSLAISKDNNLDVIIPDESVNPSFDLH